MDNERLTIERVLDSDPGMILYRLSNGDILNKNEVINYIKQGKLEGVIVTKDNAGEILIKSTELGINNIE